jgi:hypothetical protein
MTVAQMDSALVSAYQAVGLGLPTSYPGEEFEPPTDGSDWAKVHQLPSGTSQASTGSGGWDRHQGIFQVDFNTELGSGRDTLLTYAQAILDYFFAGRRFNYGGQVVRISIAERSNIREVDGYQRISVSVYWFAHTIRPTL